MTVPRTTAEAKQLVDKLWSYCHVLRDDGVSTIDYTEQLTYLLFLKMAQERADRKAFGAKADRAEHLGWQTLLDADGDELKAHYEHILDRLGRTPRRRWALIFHKAREQHPGTRRR